MDEAPWWHGAVVYQIYPRSFADANGDGDGDLSGIRAHLDHLVWLGVDAVWLSPFYRSPMADGGYDVADHCSVDPRFGDLEDAEALVHELHERGLRVLVDFVPNHTSSQHPWFLASRRERDDPRRSWYIWRGGGTDPRSVPNNWRAAFTGETAWERDDDGQLRPRWGLEGAGDHSAWTFDDTTEQYYLHTFLPDQPDLDWRNPEVVAAQHDVLRFWLDLGVDGFRVDAVITLGKPEGLPDADPASALVPEAGLTDEAFVQSQVRDMRALTNSYEPERILVGEVGGADPSAVERYVDHELFHLTFAFAAMFDRWEAKRWRRHIEASQTLAARDVWPGWVLSNHDAPRHAERYGTLARARAAAVALLGLRGCAFLFAGEELGLRDAAIEPDERRDPGGRDGARAPIPWTDAPGHGWGPHPWLPFPPDAEVHNVERQRADPTSMLQLYRRLLVARRASPALRLGDLELVEDTPDGVLAWWRRRGDDERLVVVNFTAEHHSLAFDGTALTLEVSTDDDGAQRATELTGALGPDQAIIARPR